MFGFSLVYAIMQINHFIVARDCIIVDGKTSLILYVLLITKLYNKMISSIFIGYLNVGICLDQNNQIFLSFICFTYYEWYSIKNLSISNYDNFLIF